MLDLYTRRIAGWQIVSHMRQSLVSAALELAIASGQDAGLTVAHSGSGSQCTTHEYTERLKLAGLVPSRGRTGTARDNAMTESVINTLTPRITKRHTWRLRLDLDLALELHRLVRR